MCEEELADLISSMCWLKVGWNSGTCISLLKNWFIYSSLIHYTPTAVPLPLFPVPPAQLPTPQIHSSSIPFRKEQVFQGYQPGLTSYSKTKHRPLYQGWIRPLSRRKRVPRAGKRARDTPTPTVRSPTGTPSYTTRTQTHRGSLIVTLVSVRLREPWSVEESTFLASPYAVASVALGPPPSGHWSQCHCAWAIFSKPQFSGNQGSSCILAGLGIKLDQCLLVKLLVFNMEPQCSLLLTKSVCSLWQVFPFSRYKWFWLSDGGPILL